MEYDKIVKDGNFKVKPNIYNYEKCCDEFTWEGIENSLDWLDKSAGKINIAYEAIDRHTKTDKCDKTAMIWEGKNGEVEHHSYSHFSKESNKVANLLKSLNVKRGDRIFTFLDRIPEHFFSIFGILKAGCVVGPLFSAFGPDAIKDRLEDSEAVVLFTSPALLKKVYEVKDDLPALKHIIVVDKDRREAYQVKDGELDYNTLIEAASEEFTIENTDREDFAVMHYTSGTTGKPKGAAHVHNAVMGHYATAKYVLDMHEDDIYWCTADPGWVTGTSYGMFGPWTNGLTQIIYEGGFSANKWYSIIEKYNVTIWYTAPTAIRMLMKAGDKPVKKYDLSSLRYACSVGEPLNPEAVVWGKDVLGHPFHDNWWQTETGCIQIANYPIQDIKPGSMGRPFPSVRATILSDDFKEELPIGVEGHLALKSGWPSMFRTYWKKDEKYKSCFKNGWYVTGDKAKKDEDGYFWFIGRSDDVINTAGHLVGPFEVESALVEHPAVAEAGVIGKPDPIVMEKIKAFISLKDGYEASDELLREIKRFAKKKLSTAANPKEIEILPSLPKTRSGKIMRRLLKARELGLPEGDTSTLED